MEAVLDELEDAARVPLPAIEVANEQDIELITARRGQHLAHRRRPPHGSARVADDVLMPGIDETPALDEFRQALTLAVGTVSVLLAGRRLADPTRGAEIHRSTQINGSNYNRDHGTEYFWFVPVTCTGKAGTPFYFCDRMVHTWNDTGLSGFSISATGFGVATSGSSNYWVAPIQVPSRHTCAGSDLR